MLKPFGIEHLLNFNTVALSFTHNIMILFDPIYSKLHTAIVSWDIWLHTIIVMLWDSQDVVPASDGYDSSFETESI